MNTPTTMIAAITAASERPTRDAIAQVRLDDALAERLDDFVIVARSRGARGVTRSSVLRAALEGFLDAAEQELKSG